MKAESARIEEALSRMTAAFEADVELREELKAELRGHLEEALEEGRATDVDEALAQLGPPAEVAGELEAANRRRMKRRALASLVLKGVILPTSLAAGIWAGWSEGRRALGFYYPKDAGDWIEMADRGELWSAVVLGQREGWSSARDPKWERERALLNRFTTRPEGVPKHVPEDALVSGSVLDLDGYLAAKRAELARSAMPKVEWMETFDRMGWWILRTARGEEAREALLAFCEEIDPGNGYYALMVAGQMQGEIGVAQSELRRSGKDASQAQRQELAQKIEVAGRVLERALAADYWSFRERSVPVMDRPPQDVRFEQSMERLFDARARSTRHTFSFHYVPRLVETEAARLEEGGDAEGARRILRSFVEMMLELASQVTTPEEAHVVTFMARNGVRLLAERLQNAAPEDGQRLARLAAITAETFYGGLPRRAEGEWERTGLLGDWFGFWGQGLDSPDRATLRRLDYVVVERLGVAAICVVLGLGVLVLVVLRLLGPKPREGLPLRLVLRFRDYAWLFAGGTLGPVALLAALVKLTPLGMRHLNATVTFPTWALQFASLAILIAGLNWMLARRVVRVRFAQLGVGSLATERHRGSVVVVVAALGIFLLAPLAATETADERYWGLGLAICVAGLVLIILLRGAVGLLRCGHDPRGLAPGQAATAGVAAVAWAVAAVALGVVVSPLLRAEEARLLENRELQVDPATGLTGLEIRRVQTFLERLQQQRL